MGVSIAVLGGPTTTASTPDPSTPPTPDSFPRFESIEGNVGFWIRVFSEWGLGQAVVHDTERPELVYEVIDLPGTPGESYTAEQQTYLRAVVEGWSDYLAYLEAQIDASRPLSDVDRGWILHVTGISGTNGLDGAADRLRTQRGLRERFRQGLERSGRYDAAIRSILEDEGLPVDLAFLPHVESSYQWQAYSKAGAAGLWQFTRGTGQRYMTITTDIDERLDPLAATRAAARYLREAYDALESWPLALTSYNHGVNGMVRAKQLHGDFESVFRDYRGRAFGFASRNFYAEFLAAREVASRSAHYFPEGFSPAQPMDEDQLVLPHRTSPSGIARAYRVSVEDLARLNPAWGARARAREITLPAGTRVWLPAGTLEARARDAGELPRLPEPARAHVVQRGDTLNEIAGRYRVQFAELLRVNRLDADAVIHPGQQLHIP